MSRKHSILCPFYNEEGNLPELHRRLKEVAGKLGDCEIVYIDDGSTDGGPGILSADIAGDPACKLIRFQKNYGKTAALLAGIEHSDGDIIASIDADLQSPPESILDLARAVQDGADMAIGIRQKRRDTFVKRWTSRISNKVRRFFINDRIRDVGCDLRVFRRATTQYFFPYEGFHRFFPAVVSISGFKVAQIPTPHGKRFTGTSKYGFGNRSLNVVWDLASVRWMLRRRVAYRLREKA